MVGDMHGSLAVASSRTSSSSADVLPMLISPRVSSPLTPPATGEGKATGNASDEERQVGNTYSNAAAAAEASCGSSTSPPYHPAYPIRDSPRNPFLSGGAADAGLSGPRQWQARQRMACIPPREYGKMTYVFRGQRVTYADPYASEDDDEDEDHYGATTRRDEYGHALPKRTMDRMQPCLLFPHAPSSSAAKFRPTSVAAVTHRRKRSVLTPRQERQASQNLVEADNDEVISIASLNKRRRADLSAENRTLLERLDRAGWRSDGEEEEDEEDEVDQRCIGAAVADSRHPNYSSHPHRHADIDADDDADDEDGEDADNNPFLDTVAPPSSDAARRPISNLPSRAWHHPHLQFHQRFAHLPRGHAHSLAHSMHVPDHLKCRRY